MEETLDVGTDLMASNKKGEYLGDDAPTYPYRYFQDERASTEILQDWMLSLGFGPLQSADFLVAVGLCDVLTTENWQKLLDGKARADKNLVNTLIAHLPASILMSESGNVVTTRHRLRRQLIHSSMDLDVISLPDDEYIRHRSEFIKNRFGTVAVFDCDETPDNESQDILHAMLEYGRRHFSGMTDDELLEIAKTSFKTNSKQFCASLAEAISLDLAQVIRWSNQYLSDRPERTHAGTLLRTLRHYSNLTQKELADRIGCSNPAISLWENGIAPIDYTIFPRIINSLYLTETEKQVFTRLRFPALDSSWLDKQPEKDRAGMFLRSCRQRLGIELKDIPHMILDTSLSTYAKWETGERKIPAGFIEPITKALALSEDEKPRLLTLRFPALDEKWLAKQPVRKQGGMLLAAYRECKKAWEQQELADAIGVKKSTLAAWEVGNAFINPYYIPVIAQKLGLTEEEKNRLLYLRLPYTNPENLKNLPEPERAGRFLACCRDIANLSQANLAERCGTDQSRITAWENGTNQINAEFMASLAEHTGMTDAQKQRFEYLRFPGFDPEWLAEQPEADRARFFLASAMERAAIDNNALGKSINVHAATISQWRTGEAPINALAVIPIARACKLTKQETRRFLETRFPALNLEWLVSQPPKERVGKLLQAYRDLAGFTSKTLGVRVRSRAQTINNWERERYPIPEEAVNKLCQTFRGVSDQLPENYRWFDDLEEARFREEARKRRIGMTNVNVSHGATAPATAALGRDEVSQSVT